MLTKQDIQIFKIASKDESRPVLTTVLVTKIKLTDPNGGAFNSSAGWAIKLTATDAYELTEKIVPVSEEPEFERLLIPATKLQEVAKVMAAKDQVEITPTHFKISNFVGEPKTEISLGETIEGNYPEYEKIIPSDKPVATATVNPKLLIKALEQADGQTVELELRGDPHAPMILLSNRELGGNIKSVVMPLRK